jgi:hypothetical protein
MEATLKTRRVSMLEQARWRDAPLENIQRFPFSIRATAPCNPSLKFWESRAEHQRRCVLCGARVNSLSDSLRLILSRLKSHGELVLGHLKVLMCVVGDQMWRNNDNNDATYHDRGGRPYSTSGWKLEVSPWDNGNPLSVRLSFSALNCWVQGIAVEGDLAGLLPQSDCMLLDESSPALRFGSAAG